MLSPPSAGLAEFMVLPTGKHYRGYSRGMTDTNFALVAFDAVEELQSRLEGGADA